MIIIIGILAAISIPTFLAQREKAWEAAAQSDLRNAAAAATTCSAANGGNYSTCGAVDGTGNLTFAGDPDNYGFHQSDQVKFAVLNKTNNRWGVDAQNRNGGGWFYFDTGAGSQVKPGQHTPF